MGDLSVKNSWISGHRCYIGHQVKNQFRTAIVPCKYKHKFCLILVCSSLNASEGLEYVHIYNIFMVFWSHF